MKRRAEAAQEAHDGVREIPKWARRYAQNRTLATVVFFLIIALSVTALAPLVYFAERAYRAGDLARAVVFVVLTAVVAAWILWFRFVSGAGISRRVGQRLYRAEGAASTASTPAGSPAYQAPSLPHFLLLFCLLAWYGMLLIGAIPNRQMLPTSALFMVPFLVYFYAVRFRHKVSPFMLLWPALYALHAGSLALGAPIYFHGGPGNLYEGINLVVPTLGYGLIAALAGHMYSRLALRRLRQLAGSPDLSDGQ
jgi:hypothetical protein